MKLSLRLGPRRCCLALRLFSLPRRSSQLGLQLLDLRGRRAGRAEGQEGQALQDDTQQQAQTYLWLPRCYLLLLRQSDAFMFS